MTIASQCPYHGWQFDGDGKCRKIPSLGKNAKHPGPCPGQDAYDVEEKYGIVFAFLGDLPAAERPAAARSRRRRTGRLANDDAAL